MLLVDGDGTEGGGLFRVGQGNRFWELFSQYYLHKAPVTCWDEGRTEIEAGNLGITPNSGQQILPRVWEVEGRMVRSLQRPPPNPLMGEHWRSCSSERGPGIGTGVVSPQVLGMRPDTVYFGGINSFWSYDVTVYDSENIDKLLWYSFLLNKMFLPNDRNDCITAEMLEMARTSEYVV